MSQTWIPDFDVPPRIFASAFPEAEQDAISHVTGLLGSLLTRVRDFEAAIELHKFSTKQFEAERKKDSGGGYQVHFKFIAWQFMAARDGAMTLFHFFHIMNGIRKSQKDCPIFRASVDHNALRAANKHFSDAFPQFMDVRHAVAHDAELTETPEARDKTLGLHNFQTIGGHQVVISNSLSEKSFQTTIDGRSVSYDITEESLEKLVTIKREIYSAFRTVETESGKRSSVKMWHKSDF